MMVSDTFASACAKRSETPSSMAARLLHAGDGGVVWPAKTIARMSVDSAQRKAAPIATGVLDYFPAAMAEIAKLSKIGNDKHNPGQPMHWSREKSDDHADCIMRHMIDRGTLDTDGILHDAKVAWRALAQLQIALEKLAAQVTP